MRARWGRGLTSGMRGPDLNPASAAYRTEYERRSRLGRDKVDDNLGGSPRSLKRILLAIGRGIRCRISANGVIN